MNMVGHSHQTRINQLYDQCRVSGLGPQEQASFVVTSWPREDFTLLARRTRVPSADISLYRFSVLNVRRVTFPDGTPATSSCDKTRKQSRISAGVARVNHGQRYVCRQCAYFPVFDTLERTTEYWSARKSHVCTRGTPYGMKGRVKYTRDYTEHDCWDSE